MRMPFVVLICTATLLTSTALFCPAQDAPSVPPTGIPRLVSFSGTVLDPDGNPHIGDVTAIFAIYRESTGGAPLWRETQNLKLDSQGHYDVSLGATQTEGLPIGLFPSNEQRWLGVQAVLADEPEQPRVLLVSVPYAIRAADADSLGGLPASAFLKAPVATSATGNLGITTSEAEAAGAGRNSAPPPSTCSTDCVVTDPAATQSIAQPTGTSFNVNRQGAVRFADQFSGTDMCARISAAITDLPSTGGTVDARSLDQTQSCGSNPFGTSTKPVTLLLGAATISLTVQITVPTPGSGETIIRGLGESTNISLQNTSAFLQLGSNIQVRDLEISSAQTSVINGAIFSQGTSNLQIDHVTFVGGGYQLALNTVSHFRIVQTRHEKLTAPGGAISIYECDHGTLREPRVEGASTWHWPAFSSSLRAIGISSSQYIDVESPIVRDLDGTEVAGFGALSFSGSNHVNLVGGQLVNNKGGDGFVSEGGSTDVNIVGTVSSGNGGPGGAGTNGGQGDGFDIFNSARVHLSSCTAVGNGLWTTNPHTGIEVVSSCDVTVEGCDASSGGGNGVSIGGSPRVALMGVSSQSNASDGLYVYATTGSSVCGSTSTVQSSVQVSGGQYNGNGLNAGGNSIFENGMYFAAGSTAIVQGATGTGNPMFGARLENTARGTFMLNNFRGNTSGEIQDSVGKSPIMRDDGTTNALHSVGPCCS
jgi:hypothetical protein